MPYWNRDLCEPLIGTFPGRTRRSPANGWEPLKAWCDGCFTGKITTAEKFMGEGATAEDYAAQVFGGIDSLVELALSDKGYADSIECYLTDNTLWAPDGYAWANWTMGTQCKACGKKI